jgi:hypothetical protein
MRGNHRIRLTVIALVALSIFTISIAPATAGKRGHKRKEDPAAVPVPAPTDSPTPTPTPTATPTPTPTGTPSPTVSPSPTSTPTPPVDTSGISTWAPEFMASGTGVTSYQATQALALRQAQNFDIIAAHMATYKPWVSQMKAANPDLELDVYVNGTFSSSKSSTQYPESWYARDKAGNKIMARGFNTWLMNPRSTAWISEVTSTCQYRLSYSGYDGCFIDVLGTSGLNPTSVTGLPIDPRTGLEWTKRDWMDATSALGASVRSSIAPRPIMANGLGFGVPYFDPTAPRERLLDGVSTAMAEVFVREPGSPVNFYRNETTWKKDVDMVADAVARGSRIVVTTKVWTSATAAQIDDWHRYALATFLLGYSPGRAFFTFRSDHLHSTPSPYWDVPIGAPTGPYAKVGSIYRRAFSNGLVLVNPTTSSATMALPGSYATLNGNVVTSVTLPPHTGQILTNA